LSTELEGLAKKKGEIRAELLKPEDTQNTGQATNIPIDVTTAFDAGRLVMLLSLLLRRKE
jgi:hypothetical protein